MKNEIISKMEAKLNELLSIILDENIQRLPVEEIRNKLKNLLKSIDRLQG